jgi:hypothetical protein
MPDSKVETQESRTHERFLVEPAIEGSFAGSALEILDLAEKGFRARHSAPMRPGMEGLVTFRVAGSAGTDVRLRARIVWCRLSNGSSPDGKLLYLSGVRFEETSEALSQTIQYLLTAEQAYRDVGSMQKKIRKESQRSSRPAEGAATIKVIRQRRRIDQDTLLLVKQAWFYLKENPHEAMKWYNRAKYALKTDVPKLQRKDDVLAIWEYLERSVLIEVIEWVLDNEHLV